MPQVVIVNSPGPQGGVGPQGPSGSFDNISGSFLYTSSFNAFTASINAFTSSYNTGSFTGSFTGSANLNILSASNVLVTGNVTVLGTASINTLVVNQTQLSTGSNQLGDAANDFQTLYGTVRIPTGSLTVTGSVLIEQNNPINFGNQVNIQRAGTNILYGSSLETIVNTIGTSPIRFQIGSSEVARITGSFFGIGTSSPQGKLDVSAGLASQTAGDLVVDTTTNIVYVGKLDSVSGNTNLIFRNRLGQVKSKWANAGAGSIWFGSFTNGYGLGIQQNDITTETTLPGNAYFYVDKGTLGGTVASFINGNVGIGTTTPSASLDIRGTQIATGSIARTMLISSSLSASANNDVLVGLDINPTFSNGAFTGVSNIGLRVSSITSLGNLAFGLNDNYIFTFKNFTSSRTISINPQSNVISSSDGLRLNFISNFTISQNDITKFYVFGTGNLILQNGGTFTDAGYRLDVKGSTRVQGTGTTSATTTLRVENSSASPSLTITDDLNSRFFGNVGIGTLPSSGSLHISASASTSSAAVYIYKSGSTTLDIQGSQGQLFSVTDVLSGSLMSVNDISGIPILEVFSDDKVVMGSFSNPPLVVSGSSVRFPATGSAAPTYSGSEGQTLFTVVGGNAFMYVWLAGRWRSGSLA